MPLWTGNLRARGLDAVRAHLAASPADAARVEAWRAQNAAIRRAFEPLPRETTPRFAMRASDEALRPGVAETPRLDLIRAARRRRQAATTVAVFLSGACVAVLGAVAFNRIGGAPEQSFEAPAVLAPAAQARRARIAWRSYAREVDRFFDQPIADPAVTASALQRATALPRIPDFSREKFELVTVRTMPGEAEPAAFLLYRIAGAGAGWPDRRAHPRIRQRAAAQRRRRPAVPVMARRRLFLRAGRPGRIGHVARPGTRGRDRLRRTLNGLRQIALRGW